MVQRTSSSAAPQRFPRDLWGLAYLEREGLIGPEAAREIRQSAAEWAAEEVVRRGLLDSQTAQQAFARAARVPVADLGAVEPAAVHLVAESVARHHGVLALSASDRVIRLATSNPLDLDAEQALAFATSRQVEFHYALPGALARRLDEIYRPERHIERLVEGLGSATVETIEEPTFTAVPIDTAVEAPTARLVDATIADAVRERASDIHFEPTDQGLTIRYRVDGVLREVMKVPHPTAAAVVRRVKVMGKMDVSDPLRPHDGRAAARVDLKEWDLRISSVPIARLGEKVVIRLLDSASTNLKLDAIGLWDDERRALECLLDNRDGIVLVTGPTGSGKTSTLYAALDRIRSSGVNVVTVEDPVEYRLPGVNQIQVSEKQGFTFAAALRSVLRQDPDVVLLGEIRDAETAQVAWQAALSGHFVMSTLHTNDAASTVARLADIGVEPYKMAAALKGIVAQRLLRKLCPKCAVASDPERLPPYARPHSRFDRKVEIRESKGCAFCSYTGYRGRFAVAEILTVDGSVAEMISSGASTERLIEAGRRFGMLTLWESGIRRVWTGETSYGEV
ncbi:MAG TPA: GspE/PulE family protein, partial [Gemmatimonadales bacterium]|nr:GspE/PulE family protein [Gemmatimonadales bacterium]